eukprot:4859390-Pleurochrysis_carterae.AAC.1
MVWRGRGIRCAGVRSNSRAPVVAYTGRCDRVRAARARPHAPRARLEHSIASRIRGQTSRQEWNKLDSEATLKFMLTPRACGRKRACARACARHVAGLRRAGAGGGDAANLALYSPRTNEMCKMTRIVAWNECMRLTQQREPYVVGAPGGSTEKTPVKSIAERTDEANTTNLVSCLRPSVCGRCVSVTGVASIRVSPTQAPCKRKPFIVPYAPLSNFAPADQA